MSKKLVGRKLYIHWKENMYVAIEKIPDGGKKIADLKASGLKLELCNVLEDENGNHVEESLGAPANDQNWHRIEYMFTEPSFWKTLNEHMNEGNT